MNPPFIKVRTRWALLISDVGLLPSFEPHHAGPDGRTTRSKVNSTTSGRQFESNDHQDPPTLREPRNATPNTIRHIRAVIKPKAIQSYDDSPGHTRCQYPIGQRNSAHWRPWSVTDVVGHELAVMVGTRLIEKRSIAKLVRSGHAVVRKAS